MEYSQHKYMIKRPAVTVADENLAADKTDDDKSGHHERSILVRDVPDRLAEAVMESIKTGGGAIELCKRDNRTGTMLFTFLSKDGL